MSPAACIPQADRRDRPIYDYTYSGLNAAIIPSAAPEALQLGHAFHRIVRTIVTADPTLGPVFISKTDLADAYMRVWVDIVDIPKLAFAIPPLPGDPDQLIGFHLSLPMGYVESASYFCSATETVADLTNHGTKLVTPHPLEDIAHTMPPNTDPASSGVPSRAFNMALDTSYAAFTPAHLDHRVDYTDVYVDDFVTLCQGPPAFRRSAIRNLFHNIDRVFRPNDKFDDMRREPNSTKKLLRGDARFSTCKKVLGWYIDCLQHHLLITPSRLARVDTLLRNALANQRTSLRSWLRLLGTLRSLTMGIPGSRGLFSTLQAALPNAPHRIRITPAVRETLQVWQSFLRNMEQRPTHLSELFPSEPTWFGASDACGHGLGGVFFDRHGTPFVWQWPLDESISGKLRTDTNPHGSVTINALELLAHVLQVILKTQYMMPLEHTLDGVDSTSALGWANRGSVSADSIVSRLLCWKAVDQRRSFIVSSNAYIPGPLNVFADTASRFQRSPSQLLTLFNHRFPQNVSWQHVPLPLEMSSAATSLLLGRRLAPESLPGTPKRQLPCGPYGWTFAPPSESTPTSRTSQIPSLFSKFLRTGCEPDSSPKKANQSRSAKLRRTFAPWDRRSPAWGPTTHVTTTRVDSTSSFTANYAATLEATLRPPASSPSQQEFSTTSSLATSPALQNNIASPTSYGLRSSSLCALASTATQGKTTTPHPSGYAMSSFAQARQHTTHLTRPSASSTKAHTSRSRSLTKKTELKANPSVTVPQVTQPPALSVGSPIEWHTCAPEGPPTPHPCAAITTATSGEPSKVPLLQQPCATASPCLAQASASRRTKCRPDHSEPAGQWPYSLAASTPTPSALLVDGEAAHCSVTSTSQQGPSRTTTPTQCSNKETTTYSPPHPPYSHNTRGHFQGNQRGGEKLNLVNPSYSHHTKTTRDVACHTSCSTDQRKRCCETLASERGTNHTHTHARTYRIV